MIYRTFILGHMFKSIPFKVAISEGNTLDDAKLWNASHNTTRKYCKRWCNSCEDCKSFSICNDSECRLKDKLVRRADLTIDSANCTTYYKFMNTKENRLVAYRKQKNNGKEKDFENHVGKYT